MAFMAAAPLVMSAVSTGAGIAGQAGLFGGKGEDSGKNIRDFNNQQSALGEAVALNDYQRGLALMKQYQDGYNFQDALYRQNANDAVDQARQGERRWGPVADAQAGEILADISRYAPYKDASVQSGMNILDYVNNQIANEKAIMNDSQNARLLANRDTEDMLNQSRNVYRPAETKFINELSTTGLDSTKQQWQEAQDYFNKMKNTNFKDSWANSAGFDAMSEFEKQRAASQRERLAYGNDPNSGNSRNADIDLAINEALGVSGARTKGMQTGEVQDLTNYQNGLNTLMNSSNQLNSNLNSMTGTIQKGPMNASGSIFSKAGSYSAPNPTSFMMPQMNSTTGQSAMQTTQMNPVAPNYAQMGTLAQTNLDRLYKSITDGKHSESGGSSQDTSSAGFGGLAGLGLSGLTNSKNWNALNSSTTQTRDYGSDRVKANY